MRVSRKFKIVLLAIILSSSVYKVITPTEVKEVAIEVKHNNVDPSFLAMISSGVKTLSSDVRCNLPEYYKNLQEVSHTVKSGETLSSILAKYNANQKASGGRF